MLINSLSPEQRKFNNIDKLETISQMAQRVLSVVIKNKDDILYRPETTAELEIHTKVINSVIVNKLKQAYIK